MKCKKWEYLQIFAHRQPADSEVVVGGSLRLNDEGHVGPSTVDLRLEEVLDEEDLSAVAEGGRHGVAGRDHGVVEEDGDIGV